MSSRRQNPPRFSLRPTRTARGGGWLFWILFALLLLGALARILRGVRF